jgi:hypothetical protein
MERGSYNHLQELLYEIMRADIVHASITAKISSKFQHLMRFSYFQTAFTLEKAQDLM